MLSLVLSLCLALVVYALAVCIAGASMPTVEGILYLWLASACLVIFSNGLANVKGVLAASVVVCVFALGLTSGYLPVEGLPAFWQDWVYPWVPQRFIGEGLRLIMYMDAGAWNASCAPLLAYAAIGVLFAVASLFMSRRPTGKAEEA